MTDKNRLWSEIKWLIRMDYEVKSNGLKERWCMIVRRWSARNAHTVHNHLSFLSVSTNLFIIENGLMRYTSIDCNIHINTPVLSLICDGLCHSSAMNSISLRGITQSEMRRIKGNDVELCVIFTAEHLLADKLMYSIWRGVCYIFFVCSGSVKEPMM